MIEKKAINAFADASVSQYRGYEPRQRGYDTKPRFKTVKRVAALAGMLGLIAAVANANDTAPDCKGTQTVDVNGQSNSISAMKHDYIDVPKGEWADLSMADYTVLRHSKDGSFTPVEGAQIIPGDQVQMPKTCS